jgi:hypothetical protein
MTGYRPSQPVAVGWRTRARCQPSGLRPGLAPAPLSYLSYDYLLTRVRIVLAGLTRRLRINPRSHKASHHEFKLLDASVKMFILERDCSLAAVTNEFCMIAKPSKGSRMLVPAVDTDDRDRRVIKACFPHGRDPTS